MKTFIEYNKSENLEEAVDKLKLYVADLKKISKANDKSQDMTKELIMKMSKGMTKKVDKRAVDAKTTEAKHLLNDLMDIHRKISQLIK